jgi:xanthine dehydrogenase accessory factor
MRDVLDDLLRWWKAGETVGLAVVTATWSSAPRQPGAAMLVGPDGTAVGSVSGGCVEGAVYELCREVAESGEAQAVRYGVSDDDAYEVGLPCGGTIELFVAPISPATLPDLPRLAAAVYAGQPVALLTRLDTTAQPDSNGRPDSMGKAEPAARHLVLTPDDRLGSLGGDRIDEAAADDGRGLLAAGRTGLLHYGMHGERRGSGLTVLVNSFAPAARMIVFGATDHAAAVVRVGSFLGYRVTVCDARPVFATARRFPDADEVVVDWPHRYLAAEASAGRVDERTVVCVLTHDPKFDVPVLEVALRLPIAYVGAMGSRRTHDDRLARLRETELDGAAIARLASPIGLDLGARTPEETAVSIAAEIVALRWGGSGDRLTLTEGRIHSPSS